MPNIRPYGAPIADAMKRGDKSQMKSVLADAKKYVKAQGNLGKAIKDLETAIKKKSAKG